MCSSFAFSVFVFRICSFNDLGVLLGIMICGCVVEFDVGEDSVECAGADLTYFERAYIGSMSPMLSQFFTPSAGHD